MNHVRTLLCAVAGAVLLAMAAAGSAKPRDGGGQATVIHAGTLIAIPGRPALHHASIVVKDGRIAAIQDGYANIHGARTIDLTRSTVLPGLIDCHVHLTMPALDESKAGKPARLTAADYMVAGVVHARQTLEAGFTTVRDVGADSEAIFPLRDAIARDDVPGPRVLAAGRMVAGTGGHGDIRGYPDVIRDMLVGASTCDGPFDCRRAVRLQIAHGADVIKIATTGGGGDAGGNPDAPPEMMPDEVQAVVQTAHALGRKVASHAHGTAGILLAIRSGVDSVEHGGFLNSEAISLMKAGNVTLVPTLSVLDRVAKELPTADPKDQPRMRAFLERMPGNIAAAWRAGVRIAMGTDAGITPHGGNARELEWYVRIGMTPEAALQTATVNAAYLLGLDHEVGTIESGKAADIVATDTNPLTDISALRRISFVMKGGVVYRGTP